MQRATHKYLTKANHKFEDIIPKNKFGFGIVHQGQ